MGGNDTIVGMLEVVLRRFTFVETLEDDPKDKRTLVADLDCSRSTVDRGIRELEALDLVEYVDGGYRMTSLGATVTSGLADLAETVELRLQLAPFLEWAPEDVFDLDLECLDNADLLLPEPGDPYAMINRHVSVLGQAGRIRCVLPLTGLHAHKTAHRQVVENGTEVEVVGTPEVAQTMQSDPDYAGLTNEMADTGRFKIFQYNDDIPYFVGLMDEIVHIGVDDGGVPRAIVESDDSEVREWAAATFETYRQQADPVIASRERTKIRS